MNPVFFLDAESVLTHDAFLESKEQGNVESKKSEIHRLHEQYSRGRLHRVRATPHAQMVLEMQRGPLDAGWSA
jgi:hypothetical protein